MADINARLLQAIDGSAPQHKVRGQNRFEFSEGSDRTLHVKIAGKNGNPLDFEGDKFPVEDKQLQSVINELNKVKSELESIKNGTLKVKNDQLIDKIDALLAKQQSLEDKINSVMQGNAFRTQLTGSYVGYSTETKPTGRKGEIFLEIDKLDVYVHDGSGWVKI